MSDGVFGDLINERTLKGMPKYKNKEQITRADMAKVALDKQNADWKDKLCSKFVKSLQTEYGDGVSTRCMIYNATGSEINLLASRDWQGRLHSNPYPITIKNGQWGGWLHVKTTGASGSSAAVVYRGLNNNGYVKDWLHSWDVPVDQSTYVNRVYAEAREEGHFAGENWDFIRYYLSPYNHKDSMDGCISSASIGSGTTPEYVAVMTLTET